MEVEFESPEQLQAFQRMQSSHPEAVEQLIGQGAKLQARVAELDLAIRDIRGPVYSMKGTTRFDEEAIESALLLVSDPTGGPR